MQYAKIVEDKLQYPVYGEFIGIPNWQQHDYQLRKRGYLPLVGEAEQRDGFEAVPSAWHIVGDGGEAYIHVDAWEYTEIPAPEPVLRRQFTKGELLEALIACNLYDQAKAIYANDLDLQIAWAGFADIDMDYPATVSIMQQYPELFAPENVEMLQRYITFGTEPQNASID